ncbi:HlyD family secretion protein [Mesorhizobium sp. BAC0120]|uniref:HlyD family secretion protein n=1 Tax=Mesorhizobium sp. BAC0120 TaxID=3090670 RepID=UPI00298D3EBF|nr:HlyD family secretion protein [Mesorhizobium sp. BAC0120]MDW6020144.1 HlyD family secretion protein [Mesorhizobium sp. BAC0120]
MSIAKTEPENPDQDVGKSKDVEIPPLAAAEPRVRRRLAARVVPVLVTLVAIAVAAPLCWWMWQTYMAAPWTRDGTVRSYVVTMAPEVAGRIVELPVVDNQLVREGDLLMVIDPTNFKLALGLAEASVKQADANAENAQAEAERRHRLSELTVTQEERQTFDATALAAQAQKQQAQAARDQARVNLERTRIVAPCNCYVTNLLVQRGAYVNVGDKVMALVNAETFWVDGYFEETALGRIREGSPATVKLMGSREVLRGHVESIARGIVVPNAQPGASGLAEVNPIFAWVRLAQRVPVRIHIDYVPDGVRLVAGMTATVQIETD